ncbi:small ribosomal subunit protein uS15m [Amia ocellicauda]|uniref:small ribosomal subunit protein uS15m n=1 Tax=Amia ocellicauda TaxID=2972642 RepID=UPI003463C784
MLLRRALRAASCVREWSSIAVAAQSSVRPAGRAPSVAAVRAVSERWTSGQGLPGGNGSFAVQPVRSYARAIRKKQASPSQLSDLPPTLLKKEFAAVQIAQTTDAVVRKLLSLELASHKEKVDLKKEELVAKVRRSEADCGSTEVQVAILTARIRNYQEHLQTHGKDKANRRRMLMAVDRRKKLLKYLRRTRYDAFESVCDRLGITYSFPPEYYRRVTRRWAAKKALCVKVFNEVKKLKAAKRMTRQEAEAQ